MLTTTQLRDYIPELQKYFDRVGSSWRVDKDGRHFDGLFADCPSLLASEGIDRVREIVGIEYRVYFLPNENQIIIE